MRKNNRIALLLGINLCVNSLLCAQAEPVRLDRVAAIVNNGVIMQSQLNQRMQEVQGAISKRGESLPPEHVLSQQVLERLIIEELQIQIGDRAGIRISDEELNQAMESIAQRNNMDYEQFSKAVRRDGLSIESAKEQVRREMLVSRTRQRFVADRINISDREVSNFLQSKAGRVELSEEYHLASIMIPLQSGSSPEEIQATKKQAEEVYEQLNKGSDFAEMAIAKSSGDTALDGGDMGWRSAAQLPAPFDTMVGSLKKGGISKPVRTTTGFVIVKMLDKRNATENNLRDQIHVRHILLRPSEVRSETETKQLADRVYERIMLGEDFAALAKSFSEDPVSSSQGGDLKWVDPDSLVPEFQEVMAQTATNEISPPFRSPYGYHVLQVLARRSQGNEDSARKQEAFAILQERKYDEELQTWLREIRNDAFVEIKN